MRLGRDAFNTVAGLDLDAALDYLQAGLTAVALTDDSREGVAAFMEKRSPRLDRSVTYGLQPGPG